MATFGHLASGLACSRLVGLAGRQPASPVEAAIITVAGELPDVDLLLPVRHRGRTHSLAFAGAVAACLFLARARRDPRRGLAMGLAGGLAAASHGVLDVATGESGARLRWPLGSRRVTLPNAFLPATPIGSDLFTPAGALRVLGEASWAGPLAIIGAWPWRHPFLRRR